MEIRPARAADKDEIVSLYQRSQALTGTPNPKFYPPNNLGEELYPRHAIERYVAVEEDSIVGHVLIEEPNPISVDFWRTGTKPGQDIIEMGRLFVEPTLLKSGVGTELGLVCLEVIRIIGSVPVSATWADKSHAHVRRMFSKHGGTEVGKQIIPAGVLSLFVFPKTNG